MINFEEINNEEDLKFKIGEYKKEKYKIIEVTENTIKLEKNNFSAGIFLILLLFFIVGGIIYYIIINNQKDTVIIKTSNFVIPKKYLSSFEDELSENQNKLSSNVNKNLGKAILFTPIIFIFILVVMFLIFSLIY